MLPTQWGHKSLILVRELRHTSWCEPKKKKKTGEGVYPTKSVRSSTCQPGLPTPCLFLGRRVRKPCGMVRWWWSSPTRGTHWSVWFQDVGLSATLQSQMVAPPLSPLPSPDSLNQNVNPIVPFSFKHPCLVGKETLGEPHLCFLPREPTILHAGQLVPKSV